MTGDPAVEEVTVRGLALVLTRDLGLAESVTAHVMAEGPMPLADRLAAVRREAASSAAPAGEGRDHAAFWNDPPEVRAATWLIGTGIPPSEVAVGLGMSQAGLRELLGLPAVLTTVPEAGICPSPDRLAAYSSGDLPTGEAAAIGDHLALCVDCRRQVDRFEEIADEVARMPPPPPPPPPEGALSWEPSKTAAGPAIRVVRQRGPAGAAAALSQRRRRRRRAALLVGLPAVILVAALISVLGSGSGPRRTVAGLGTAPAATEPSVSSAASAGADSTTSTATTTAPPATDQTQTQVALPALGEFIAPKPTTHPPATKPPPGASSTAPTTPPTTGPGATTTTQPCPTTTTAATTTTTIPATTTTTAATTTTTKRTTTTTGATTTTTHTTTSAGPTVHSASC